jgi:hypothetical protein
VCRYVEAVTPRGCADGDGPAMAEAGLHVVEARATRRGAGGGSGKSSPAAAAAAAAEDGGRDHRDVGEADGHFVGGRWVETHGDGGGVARQQESGGSGGVVVLVAELAMTGRASNAGVGLCTLESS